MNSPDAEPQSAWRERPDYRVDLLTADGRQRKASSIRMIVRQ